MITSTDLKKEFCKLWPNLQRQVFWQQGYIFLFGTHFEPINCNISQLLIDHTPIFKERTKKVRELVSKKEFTIEDLTSGSSIEAIDCNVIARSFYQYVEEYLWQAQPTECQKATGVAVGKKFRGINLPVNHMIYWYIDNAGLHFADPKSENVWISQKSEDEIWFVTSL